MTVLKMKSAQAGFSRPINWVGRSGRIYTLSCERLENFMLRSGEVYLLARGNLAMWAGSAEDIIEDAQSRARFRLALTCADRAFHVGAGADDVTRLTIVWDLEGGAPPVELTTAA